MDQNRLNNLLFLFSTSILVAGCPQGGETGSGTDTDEDDDDSTTTDPSSTVTTPTASASGSASTTATTTDGTTTDETTTSPPTTTDETTTTDPSETTMATTEPTTEATMATTEATTGAEGSTTEMTTGQPGDVCGDYGTFFSDCFYEGDPEVATAAEEACNGYLEMFAGIGEECGAAFEEVLACIPTLECKEVAMLGEGTDCDDELAAAQAACQ